MIGSTNSIWDMNSKYEQVVNYTMLYDGSLGDTNLNECKEVTGGWTTYKPDYAYGSTTGKNPTLTKNTTNLYHSVTGSAQIGGFKTVNEIDFSNYVSCGALLSWTYSNTYYAFEFIQNSNTASIDYSGTLKRWCNVDYGDTNFNNKMFHLNLKLFTTVSMTTNARGGSAGRGTTTVYEMCIYKQDSWQMLCEIAGLKSSDYEDETALCADSSAITTILNNEKAVEFMIKQCTGSFMGEFVANSSCLTALKNSAYKTIIMANEHWAKFLSFVA